MRPRSAAVIALRIYAAVLTVQVVTAIVSYLATSGQLGVTGQFWAVVGTRLVIAFFLWIGADAITRVMVGGLDDETPPLHTGRSIFTRSPSRSSASC